MKLKGRAKCIPKDRDAIFLPYQAKWIMDESRLKLGEKSRQVRWVSPAEGLGVYKEIYGDMGLQAMPKITKLRQCLETLKTPFLIETVES